MTPVSTPPRELAGFTHVSLDPNEETTATIWLSNNAFAYYDEDRG